MALTTRSNLVYTDNLQEAVRGAYAGKQALNGTGVALMSPTLPFFGIGGARLKGGDTVVVPYFDTVGEMEDVDEGGALTPKLLGMTDEEATVIHSGIAGEITNWAQMTAQFADPYEEFGRQFVEAAMRRIDAGLITAAQTTTLVLDVSALVAPACFISWTNIVNAKLLWGDEAQDEGPALAIMHSDIAGDLEKLVDLAGRPLVLDSMRDGKLPNFNGMPIRASDRLAPVAGVYDVLLCRKGALAAWFNPIPSIKDDEDILADTTVRASHLYHVEHLYKRPKSGIGTKPGVVKLKVKKVV